MQDFCTSVFMLTIILNLRLALFNDFIPVHHLDMRKSFHLQRDLQDLVIYPGGFDQFAVDNHLCGRSRHADDDIPFSGYAAAAV